MPLYTYRCCIQKDQYNTIANRKNGPECPECGKQMEMKIMPTMVHVPQDLDYKCPVTGQGVTTYTQRKEIMAKHNLVDANDFKPPKAEASS